MSGDWGSYSAYYWPEGQRVPISHALSKRTPYNMRAGDCWCHEDCYKNGTGRRVFPRLGGGRRRDHFWVGPGRGTRSEHPSRGMISTDGCAVSRRVKQLGEDSGSNNYYEQFYSDLKAELSGSSNMWDNIDTYYIQRVEFPPKNQRNASDLIIHHTPGNRDLTHVVIVNMSSNRKWSQNLYANGRTELNTILIDIRQWTDNQVADFASFGKRKFKDEWDKLNSRIIRHNEQVALDIKRNQERAQKEEEKRNHALIELNDAMAEVRRILDEGKYGFNEDDLRKSVDGLRWKIEFAQKRGIDTAPAEALRKEALEELDRVFEERAERNERTALARSYIPKFEIIGITPPDLTEYEDVISLFEQHQDKILTAEEELAEKRRRTSKAEAEERAAAAAAERQKRQDLVDQGHGLLRELLTNQTTFTPMIGILEFAADKRIPGHYEPEGELPHCHIKLLHIVLRDNSRMLGTWVAQGRGWDRIGIVPKSMRSQIMPPGNQIGPKSLLQNARGELDAIIPIYKDYFKDQEKKMEDKLRSGEKDLDSYIATFEDNVGQLETLTASGVSSNARPLETILKKYGNLRGAKPEVINRTNKLIEDTMRRARQKDDLVAEQKKERLEEERATLKPLETELDDKIATIGAFLEGYSEQRLLVEKFQTAASEIVAIGKESIRLIDDEIILSMRHYPDDFDENKTGIEDCKEEISNIIDDYEAFCQIMVDFSSEHLEVSDIAIEEARESIQEARLSDDYWKDEIPNRKTDLEKRIAILEPYESLEKQYQDVEERLKSVRGERSTEKSLKSNRIKNLEHSARRLCDSRLRGVLEHKSLSFWGKIRCGAVEGWQPKFLTKYRGQIFFVHGSEWEDDSVFTYQIKKGCELRFEPAENEHNGKNKLVAKRVTHYLCPNCPDNSWHHYPVQQPYTPPLKNNPTGSETKPLPVGQAIKKNQEQKKEAKKPSQQSKEEQTGKNRPKKKKGRRLGTTRGGPRKGI